MIIYIKNQSKANYETNKINFDNWRLNVDANICKGFNLKHSLVSQLSCKTINFDITDAVNGIFKQPTNKNLHLLGVEWYENKSPHFFHS